MKDKLSREELILDLNDAFAVAIEAVARQDTKDRLDQALKQIKARLQPMPKEKLDEFDKKWKAEFIAVFEGLSDYSWGTIMQELRKEYDKLKESADEK